jgi:hypothetical protein
MDAAQEVARPVRKDTRVSSLVYEIMTPMVSIITSHNERMFRELGDLIGSTLREYLDPIADTTSDVASEEQVPPDPLLTTPEFEDEEEEDPTFDMPDDWRYRGVRLGPPS